MKYRTKYRIKSTLLGIGVIFVTQMLGISLAPVLVPKYLVLFLGGWLVGMMIGTWPIYRAIKPPKYELKYCSTCGRETQQFQTNPVFREGFKYKMPAFYSRGTTSEEVKRNIIGHAYVCETCGKTNIVYLAAPLEPRATLPARPPHVPAQPAPETPIEPTKFCGQCGAKILLDSRFCAVCGAKLPEAAAVAPQPEVMAVRRRTLQPTAVPAPAEARVLAPAGVKYCVQCGHLIPEVAVYCPRCASKQEQ